MYKGRVSYFIFHGTNQQTPNVVVFAWNPIHLSAVCAHNSMWRMAILLREAKQKAEIYQESAGSPACRLRQPVEFWTTAFGSHVSLRIRARFWCDKTTTAGREKRKIFISTSPTEVALYKRHWIAGRSCVRLQLHRSDDFTDTRTLLARGTTTKKSRLFKMENRRKPFPEKSAQSIPRRPLSLALFIKCYSPRNANKYASALRTGVSKNEINTWM